jgi:hypothetical protein
MEKMISFFVMIFLVLHKNGNKPSFIAWDLLDGPNQFPFQPRPFNAWGLNNYQLSAADMPNGAISETATNKGKHIGDSLLAIRADLPR